MTCFSLRRAKELLIGVSRGNPPGILEVSRGWYGRTPSESKAAVVDVMETGLIDWSGAVWK